MENYLDSDINANNALTDKVIVQNNFTGVVILFKMAHSYQRQAKIDSHDNFTPFDFKPNMMIGDLFLTGSMSKSRRNFWEESTKGDYSFFVIERPYRYTFK